MPSTAENPLARLRLPGRFADHVHDFVPALDVQEIERQLRLAEIHEMAMPVDKARHREFVRRGR
jgi:hypothetical protein